VRDKIAASKRKGLWVGGPVPLGYRCLDKKLEIVREEAEAVRTIFARYLELGSMGALIAELDRQGIRTKLNGRRDGRGALQPALSMHPLSILCRCYRLFGCLMSGGERPEVERDLGLAGHDFLDPECIAFEFFRGGIEVADDQRDRRVRRHHRGDASFSRRPRPA
jgi:Recombinase